MKPSPVINTPLFPCPAGHRPLTLGETVELSHQYAVEKGTDGATACAYVLAGTDRHAVDPGSQDYYATIEYSAKTGYSWKFDNVPALERYDAWDYADDAFHAHREYAD